MTLCLVLNHQHRTLTLLYFSTQDFLAALFFMTGHAFSYFRVRKFSVYEGILAVMFVLVGSFYWKMATNVALYENARMLPYFLTAVLGTWSVYSLPWNRQTGRVAYIAQLIGNNTLSVLTWHFLTFKLVSLTIIYMYNLPIEHLAEFPVITDYAVKGWWLAYFLVAMAVTSAIAYCNHWIKNPWLKL